MKHLILKTTLAALVLLPFTITAAAETVPATQPATSPPAAGTVSPGIVLSPTFTTGIKITWTAENSDPRVLKWMQGSPPPPDKIIRFADGSYFKFPQLRWSVCHFQQLMPTKAVSRGLSQSVPLPRNESAAIDQITFIPSGKTEPMTWQASLAANFTDGIIVLHHGRIVYEQFAGCLSPTERHAAMSMTKSLVGLLAEMLIAEKLLQGDRLVKDYIPELANSAFGDATVRQVLDMTTGLDYSEDYADPQAGVWQHAAAGNPLPKPADYTGPQTYFEFLETVRQQGEHGHRFGYKTINTDVLGWLISRVSGKPLTEVLSGFHRDTLCGWRTQCRVTGSGAFRTNAPG